MGQGRRRPMEPEPPDRRRAAGRSNRLPRPFARLVPWARVHRQAFGRAGRRCAFGIERQAADDRDAGAAYRPGGARAAREARQKRPHLSTLVRRIQQAVQACAHRLRLALARREGSRRVRRRSALRLSVHNPTRDRRARRAPPRHEPKELAAIRKDLPIYVFSGEHDPVGANIKGLIEDLKATGFTQLTTRVYPGARHETLNETNRDEVTRDFIAWLDGIEPQAK